MPAPVREVVADVSQGSLSLCSFFGIQVAVAVLTQFVASSVLVTGAWLKDRIETAKALGEQCQELEAVEIADHLAQWVEGVTCTYVPYGSRAAVLADMNAKASCIAIVMTCGKTLTVYCNHGFYVVLDSHAPSAVARSFLTAADALADICARTNYGADADLRMHQIDVVWATPDSGEMCFMELC
jgi:hypothetical protein